MRIVSGAEIDRLLTYGAVIDALAEAFRGGFTAPPRHHHLIPQPDGTEAKLLLMPAWTEARWQRGDRYLGCKLVSVFPGNARLGRPSVHGAYLLQSGDTGEPLALLDGTTLTAWRTAAASALAARYLAREDAAHLVMIGAGALAPHLIRAHMAVRPIKRITLWNRTRSRAVKTAFALSASGIEPLIADELEPAVRIADVVCCATLSPTPIVRGAWLRPGTHLDLVGSFTPKMRECDDDAIRRSRVYVDHRTNAVREAGDIAIPLKRNIIKPTHVRGDLFELCSGKAKGRRKSTEITLFKSVGHAIEDLATAMLVMSRLQR